MCALQWLTAFVVIAFVLHYYMHFNMKESINKDFLKRIYKIKGKTKNWWWEPLIDPKYYELHKWKKLFVWLKFCSAG